MVNLGAYIAGHGEAPTRRQLNALIEEYEWFTTARRARALVTGDPDPALVLPLGFWATVPPVSVPPVSVPPVSSPPTPASSPPVSPTPVSPPPTPAAHVAPVARPIDLIDRFIAHGVYRIDPEGDAPAVRVDVDIDPGMVTPELAAIYRAQGLIDEAENIERRLKKQIMA